MRSERYMYEDAWLVDVHDSKDENERLLAIEASNERMTLFLASFPYMKNSDLAKEFHITVPDVIDIAHRFGLKKLVEHRGGHNRKKVAMINLDGYIMKVYDSVHMAAVALGFTDATMSDFVKGRRRKLPLPGVMFKYR